MPTSCIAFDVNLGCSGYVYGLLITGNLLNALGGGKALFIVGDTSTKCANERDRTVAPLFGDAGTATALEYDSNASPIFFDLHSDGSGWDAIVLRHGGSRLPITADSLLTREVEPGVFRSPVDLVLKGADVFNFGLREVPPAVNALLQSVQTTIDNVDLFVFHQANKMMNEMIRKKLRIPEAKCPYSLEKFGNTSCSSIPITLVTACRESLRLKRQTVVICGFGIGLSWATGWVEMNNVICPELLEI